MCTKVFGVVDMGAVGNLVGIWYVMQRFRVRLFGVYTHHELDHCLEVIQRLTRCDRCFFDFKRTVSQIFFNFCTLRGRASICAALPEPITCVTIPDWWAVALQDGEEH